MPRRTHPEPTIAERLRDARKGAGVTQARLADLVGATQQWIYQVETGRRPASLETVRSIALALDLDPHDFDRRLASERP